MKASLLIFGIFLFLSQSQISQADVRTPTLLASFSGAQVTGVTKSDQGRLFASFPRWRENLPYSVVEVLSDGTSRPYPNARWNEWDGSPANRHFICVQSVVAHGDSLFVLDGSNSRMQGVVGKAKVYEFDLNSNRLKNTWVFNKTIAPERSYLNDLRVDDVNDKIYITDSGLGAIVILDMKTGHTRRVLENHASTKSENIMLQVEGMPFRLASGQQPQIHADGIALRGDNQYLYYHALTGYGLYRIPVAALTDKYLDDATIGMMVEKLGQTPAADGMIFDDYGRLYMADLENNAIVYRTESGEIKTLIKDEMIKWADSFAIDIKNRELIFTTSRLHEVPPGANVENMTFGIYKIPLP